jgi:hypothetical protein
MSVEKGEEKAKKPEAQKEVVAKQPEVSSSNQVTVDANLLAQLIAQASGGNKTDDLKELIKEIKKSDKAELYSSDSRYRTEEDLDPEDYVDNGVAFYAYSNGYFISDDKRKGKPIMTPFGNTIKFEFLHATKKTSGRNAIIEPVSMYVSYSKKESEWLERHSLFGIKFFKDIKSVANVDGRKAFKLSKAMGMVKGMSVHELAKSCRDKGLPMSIDADEMRYALAAHHAEDELQKENAENEIRSVNAVREKLLVSKS